MIKLLDILELNIQKKPFIGRGGEANVYNFNKQSDKVIKYQKGDTFGMSDRSWDDNISIMNDNPDVFVKVYKSNPEKHYLVLEKVDAKKIVEEVKEMTKIFIDQNNKDKKLFYAENAGWIKPPTFEGIYEASGIIDPINIARTGILKGNTSDIKLILNILKPYPNLFNTFKNWVKFIELVNSKIGLMIDFSFENVGYDKQGNLKMFDF
jgi:hypothetical protein